MNPQERFRLGILFSAVASVAGCGGGSRDDLGAQVLALSPAAVTFERLSPKAVFTQQSGLWWNPQESGRGFTFELQGNQIFMATYTYEVSGSATWYASTLTQQSNGSFTGSMDRFAGGQTLQGAYKAPVNQGKIADATLTFTSASAANLLVTPADGSSSKSIAIEKYLFSAATSTANFENGLWWNPSQSGRGFLIDAQGSVATIASYMYDASGQPIWYLASGTIANGSSTTSALQQYANGQSLTGSFKAPTLLPASPGNIIIHATSRTTANLILPGGSTIALERFIFNSAAPVTVNTASSSPPVSAPVASATVGKTLYQQLCASCHGTNPGLNRDHILSGANSSTTILSSLSRVGDMRFLQGAVTSTDAANLAAYLATPNI